MCKVIANNLAKDDTATVALWGGHLPTLNQICYSIISRIEQSFPTFCVQVQEVDCFLLMNKMVLLAALKSMQKHIDKAVTKYTYLGALNSPKHKKIKFTSAQLTAYFFYNHYHSNGFDPPTNYIFLPLMVFCSDIIPPVKMLELECGLPIVDINTVVL